MTKPTLRISGVPISLLAIGTDEVLWIGATAISTTEMQACVAKLKQLFHDTLEEIEIHVTV